MAPASAPCATLGMYDRAETAAALDRLWTAIRAGLRAQGIAAPDRLDRTRPLHAIWTDPGLVLGQACGLPFSTWLAGRVGYVATPDHGVEGCAPGWYRSALVVARDDPAESLGELAGATAAVNAPDSQSGHAALLEATAPLSREGAFLGRAILTGAHLASMRAVAEGRARIAAIDAVTWALAGSDAEARALKVIGWTEPAPALPLVTAHPRADAVADAVEAGIAGLDAADRAVLRLRGVVRHPPGAYDALAHRLKAAEARVALPLEDA